MVNGGAGKKSKYHEESIRRSKKSGEQEVKDRRE
jgi:hypothetical protein